MRAIAGSEGLLLFLKREFALAARVAFRDRAALVAPERWSLIQFPKKREKGRNQKSEGRDERIDELAKIMLNLGI